MEKIWSLSGRYPYRCYDCQNRFYALRSTGHDIGHGGEDAAAGTEKAEGTAEKRED